MGRRGGSSRFFEISPAPQPDRPLWRWLRGRPGERPSNPEPRGRRGRYLGVGAEPGSQRRRPGSRPGRSFRSLSPGNARSLRRVLASSFLSASPTLRPGGDSRVPSRALAWAPRRGPAWSPDLPASASPRTRRSTPPRAGHPGPRRLAAPGAGTASAGRGGLSTEPRSSDLRRR